MKGVTCKNNPLPKTFVNRLQKNFSNVNEINKGNTMNVSTL